MRREEGGGWREEEGGRRRKEGGIGRQLDFVCPLLSSNPNYCTDKIASSVLYAIKRNEEGGGRRDGGTEGRRDGGTEEGGRREEGRRVGSR
jgi:hypothetical protein